MRDLRTLSGLEKAMACQCPHTPPMTPLSSRDAHILTYLIGALELLKAPRSAMHSIGVFAVVALLMGNSFLEQKKIKALFSFVSNVVLVLQFEFH